ncbi:YihY/virulence factor BrkB family protein [Nocardioides terrisoli]|uniref:YihY/virulence factor BrkB family protein n=1 Tax=Nocardioides terrisoli TaxID=3388267 RepID=UPI00287B6BD8|nr:YihY/virulence factor BrkB family protein [Nocardioides marmorisolisilvae]
MVSGHRLGMTHVEEPASPTDLTGSSWRYVARKTLREFSRDQCTDLAASLTYYSVLSLFPALIALLSLVGLVGQGPSTVHTLVGVLSTVGVGGIARSIEPTLLQLGRSTGAAGLGFVLGVLSALWSASGYVGSFGRAMNRIYEIREGRPFWKLRPMMLLVTLVAIVLAAAVALALVLTGSAAQSVGNAIGLGSTAVTIWSIAKWPVILFAVVVIVAVLYYATPNIAQPKFRWVSVGAVLAIVLWIVASVAFGFYIGNFSSYDKTYGALAGAVVFLLWLWITNLALLLGAELDSELERGRELQAGVAAERSVQLPVRDDRNIEKDEAKLREEVALGRALRESRGHTDEGR